MNSVELASVTGNLNKMQDVCNSLVGEFCSCAEIDYEDYKISNMIKGRDISADEVASNEVEEVVIKQESSVLDEIANEEARGEEKPDEETVQVPVEAEVAETESVLPENGEDQEDVQINDSGLDSEIDAVVSDMQQGLESEDLQPQTVSVEAQQPVVESEPLVFETTEPVQQDEAFEDEIAKEMAKLKQEGLVPDSSKIEITKETDGEMNF